MPSTGACLGPARNDFIGVSAHGETTFRGSRKWDCRDQRRLRNGASVVRALA
jgi:hypothetical protein